MNANSGASGTVTEVAVGSTTITVTDAGFSGSIPLSFIPPVATSSSIVGLTSGVTSYAKRTAQQLSAVVYFTDSTKHTPTSTTWSSSNPAVFSVSSSGLLSGVGAGTATLTLTADTFVSTQNITIELLAKLKV